MIMDAPDGGGSTDTSDGGSTTTSTTSTTSDPWADETDDSATYADQNLYEAAEEADDYEETTSDVYDESETVPTGIENPMNWETADGDVVAPPDNHVSDDGDVAGAGQVIEEDGSLDINPEGDVEVDPTEQDYNSDPTDDQGAQPTEEPDTALTAWTREYGADQALDSVGNVMRGLDPELPELPEVPNNIPGASEDSDIWFYAGAAVLVLGAAYYAGGE
jgi:hypothetical protein